MEVDLITLYQNMIQLDRFDLNVRVLNKETHKELNLIRYFV